LSSALPDLTIATQRLKPAISICLPLISYAHFYTHRGPRPSLQIGFHDFSPTCAIGANAPTPIADPHNHNGTLPNYRLEVLGCSFFFFPSELVTGSILVGRSRMSRSFHRSDTEKYLQRLYCVSKHCGDPQSQRPSRCRGSASGSLKDNCRTKSVRE